VVALGQRLHHFANRIDATVGETHGERVRYWFEAKKASWYAVLEAPQMPAMSTVLDHAHNAIDRKPPSASPNRPCRETSETLLSLVLTSMSRPREAALRLAVAAAAARSTAWRGNARSGQADQEGWG
jgi:hypothetical protein